jgi:hypothetical protein
MNQSSTPRTDDDVFLDNLFEDFGKNRLYLSGVIDKLRERLHQKQRELAEERKVSESLRRDLANPPGDIQELVLRKLDLWPLSAARPSLAAQPVAWRWRVGAMAAWQPGATIEPLYAAPPSATGEQFAGDIVKISDNLTADRVGLHRLFDAMEEKLYAKHLEGRGGWHNDCTVKQLEDMFAAHIDKPWTPKNLVDIANFAMMLWNRHLPYGATDVSTK